VRQPNNKDVIMILRLLIYIFSIGTGCWLVFFVFFQAGLDGLEERALTILTCGLLSIYHRLKPALSCAPVPDDCFSSV